METRQEEALNDLNELRSEIRELRSAFQGLQCDMQLILEKTNDLGDANSVETVEVNSSHNG